MCPVFFHRPDFPVVEKDVTGHVLEESEADFAESHHARAGHALSQVDFEVVEAPGFEGGEGARTFVLARWRESDGFGACTAAGGA